jgi:hypothetical protein
MLNLPKQTLYWQCKGVSELKKYQFLQNSLLNGHYMWQEYKSLHVL